MQRTVGASATSPIRLIGEQKFTYYVVFAATKEQQAITVHSAEEERARLALVDEWLGSLKLETLDPVLNTAFNFAKVRGSESIFRTKRTYARTRRRKLLCGFIDERSIRIHESVLPLSGL